MNRSLCEKGMVNILLCLFLQNDLNNKISSLPPIELIVTWPAMEDALKGIYKETTVSTVVSHNGMQTAPMTDVSRGLE